MYDAEPDASNASFVTVRRNEAVQSRPLVYLSQRHDAALVNYLVSRGWDVLRAKTIADALNLIKANRTHAGIVDFGRFALSDVVFRSTATQSAYQLGRAR